VKTGGVKKKPDQKCLKRNANVRARRVRADLDVGRWHADRCVSHEAERQRKKVAEIGYGHGHVTWNGSNLSKMNRHAPAIRAALLRLYQGRLAHYASLTRFNNWPPNELDATEID
jgi:hypothetical protein